MRYLLNTNACIVYLNQKDSGIYHKLESISGVDTALCSVVKAERFHGTIRSTDPKQTLARQRKFVSAFASLPFNDLAATSFGIICAQLEALGTPIGAYGLQLAAIALANNLTLITHNTREFSQVEGLKLEGWRLGEG